jgi:hypothetical protein
MKRYIVAAPERARNQSTNMPSLFSFEAENDDEAKAYFAKQKANPFRSSRMYSGGVHWGKVAVLCDSDYNVIEGDVSHLKKKDRKTIYEQP